MFYGIMQGRLSPRPSKRLQRFPCENWENEFKHARYCGFESIEWLFEAEDYQKNPIWTDEGRLKIRLLQSETGVLVRTLCADYFMEHPFFRVSESERRKSIEILKQLIPVASQIGVKVILIPVLEVSELRTIEEEQHLRSALLECIEQSKTYDVRLGLETELPAHTYLNLVKSFSSPYIGAYYDVGNAAYRGYDMRKDLEVLYEVLIGIHIKDRPLGGSSVRLGKGAANFKEGIPLLVNKGFQGGAIFQYYYEEDPVGTAIANLGLIQKYAKGE